MSRASFIIVLLSLIHIGPEAVAQPAVQPPSLSSQDIIELESGEILVDVRMEGSTTRGVVMAIVDAARSDVWQTIADFVGQEDWVPDMYGAEVLSEVDGGTIVRACMRVPFPLNDREYTLLIRTDHRDVDGVASDLSMWEYVEGNMDANEGYWLVQAWEDSGDRSLVVYRFEAASGIRSPGSIEERVTRRTMPGIIEGLRTQTAAVGGT